MRKYSKRIFAVFYV